MPASSVPVPPEAEESRIAENPKYASFRSQAATRRGSGDSQRTSLDRRLCWSSV